MNDSHFIPIFVFIILGILITAIILKKLKQPYVIAYLLSGVLLGPYGFDVISDYNLLLKLGENGVILLLFFAGMEICPKKFAKNWRIPVIGTILQIIATITIVTLLGFLLSWEIAKDFLFASIIALSSTAVVLKLIQDKGGVKSRLYESILGVLLVQDLAVVPMLVIVGILGGDIPSITDLTIQVTGGVLVIILAVYMAIKQTVRIPFINMLGKDQEMRVFASLVICFGMSAITGSLGLSYALGAFVGGMVVSTAKETEWVTHSLLTLKTLFLALFFLAVGMLINLTIILNNLYLMLFLIFIIYIVNTIVNALIFRSLRQRWAESLYAGAMLSQLGEFGFVLITMGLSLNIVTEHTYQFFVALISLSLFFSPLWINLISTITNKCLSYNQTNNIIKKK